MTGRNDPGADDGRKGQPLDLRAPQTPTAFPHDRRRRERRPGDGVVLDARPRGRAAFVAAGLVALTLLLGAGLGLSGALPWPWTDPAPPSAGATAPIPSASAPADGNRAGASPADGSGPGDAAVDPWKATDPDDPLSLRAFLARHGDHLQAPQARAHLGVLLREALARLEDEPDLGRRIEGLDAARARFGDAAGTDALTRARAQASAQVERLETLLGARDLGPGPADGVVTEETRAAVRRFQTWAKLPVDGAPTARLLMLLESAAPGGGVRTPASVRAPGAGAPPAGRRETTIRDCAVCPELVRIAGGTMAVGDLDGTGDADARPSRTVRVAPFWLGRFEVTRGEWAACRADGGCVTAPAQGGDPRLPMAFVSWDDARGFAAWLSAKTGKAYRLPSEAEWEAAARAGGGSPYLFADAARACAAANHADAASAWRWRNTACTDGFPDGPAPVGSFSPNALGLHDMSGNLWEWVEDCWHETYAGAPADARAWTSECAGGDRVLRGGAYSVRLENLRLAYRYRFASGARMPFFGFRVAREGD